MKNFKVVVELELDVKRMVEFFEGKLSKDDFGNMVAFTESKISDLLVAEFEEELDNELVILTVKSQEEK